ncbi:MAG: hypothetical protein QUV05_00975 [Phycisphaerae bacterium]|nr:hypothetical protein [Phycisphaerae bacterium]
MRTVKYLTLAWLLGIPACENRHQKVVISPEPRAAQARVGVYDSRAVAVAYCDSDHHRAEEQRLKEALEKARQSGDADQIRLADRALWESRKQMHRQGFSTYPVDNILEQYGQELDRIKREDNLAALISRWDAKALDKHKDSARIDVTEQLVNMLTSDTKKRQGALEITRAKPIPPAQYEEMLKKEAGKHY